MRTVSMVSIAAIGWMSAMGLACSDEEHEGRESDGGASGAGGTSDAGGESGASGSAGSAAVEHEVDPYYPIARASGNAPTPPMGWNSWNEFSCNVRADTVLETADAMVDSGMKDLGYEYVNIDDCWLEPARTTDGKLQPDYRFFSGGGELQVHRIVIENCGAGAPTGAAGQGGQGGQGGNGASSGSSGVTSFAGTSGGGAGGQGGTSSDCAPLVIELADMTADTGVTVTEGIATAPSGRRLSKELRFGAGPARITVTASGARGERTFPELRVIVGGVQVGEVVVDAETPEEFTFDFSATPGEQSVQLKVAAAEGGLTRVADYVHALGLKLGIYGSRGETCQHRAGSMGYEATDAASFAEWGIDYLKYDNCPAPDADEPIESEFRAMGEALPNDMVYSICAWQFHEWGIGLGELWRTTGDITATFESIMDNVATNFGLATYAGPNAWNDPDMLEVGVGGHMDAAAQQAHFSLWAIMAAPLIAGNDLRDMSDETLAILTNPEVIAVDQDELGIQGFPVQRELVATGRSRWVFVKPLNESGARAVLLVNGGEDSAEMGFDLDEIGLGPGLATVRDLHNHEDLDPIDDTYSTTVPSEASVMLKVQGNEPPVPHGTVALSDLHPIYWANQLGPVERDMAVGASEAEDGDPISIGGEDFERGLGVAAPAKIIYRLGQACSRFTATAGIDDFTEGRGSVVFHVLGDGEELYTSPVMTGDSTPDTIDLDVSDLHRLELRVTGANDGASWDRASIGGAELECDP